MSAATKYLPDARTFADDLHDTLSRLRKARAIGDKPEARITERRLNWLLETKIKRA